MFDFTENEKLAALQLVSYVLTEERPIDMLCESEPLLWVDASILTDAGWSKHEAAGTWGSLDKKGAIYIDTDGNDDGCWEDYVTEDLLLWAEKNWDEFESDGKPSK